MFHNASSHFVPILFLPPCRATLVTVAVIMDLLTAGRRKKKKKKESPLKGSTSLRFQKGLRGKGKDRKVLKSTGKLGPPPLAGYTR
jgi:hypothetical protein